MAFGAGIHGWGFTLRQFARMYADKLGVKEDKMMKRLWGENFYNNKTRKWSKIPEEGSVRGFNKFILEPLCKVCNVLLTPGPSCSEVY